LLAGCDTLDGMATASAAPGVVEESEDGPLLARLRAGEEAAFAELVREHSGRFLAVARRIVSNEDDARDAVQDAFLSAFRALPSFEGQARLATWLHRIVVNASLMKLRRRQRKPERSIDELLPQFLSDGHQAAPAVPWRERAEGALQHQELCNLVRSGIDQLPETYRTVLLLRDMEELDTEETARLLGVTAGVVKTRLHRARQALRTILDPHLRAGAL
jgi:RNA polymerase sigma-70 factor (ECF subfamily)